MDSGGTWLGQDSEVRLCLSWAEDVGGHGGEGEGGGCLDGEVSSWIS